MNEELYSEFSRIALELIGEGRTHWSADNILHHIRYKTRVHGDDGQFRVNNNLSSEFARRFMEDHPEHGSFFQLRRSKHDRKVYACDERTGQYSFI